jgi:hypothetical protein
MAEISRSSRRARDVMLNKHMRHEILEVTHRATSDCLEHMQNAGGTLAHGW